MFQGVAMSTTTLFVNSQKNHTIEVGAEPSRSTSWLWLICGAALLLFADGRNTIALAAWLAPALLLRFVRTQPAMRGLTVVYVAMIVVRGIAMRGMIPIPGVFYYVFMLISGISALLPYIAESTWAGSPIDVNDRLPDLLYLPRPCWRYCGEQPATVAGSVCAMVLA
jgi:hypothetical protein